MVIFLNIIYTFLFEYNMVVYQTWFLFWIPAIVYLKRLWCITTMTTVITLKVQGRVVQSFVSLTSSLRVISLTVLADSIHHILIFLAETM